MSHISNEILNESNESIKNKNENSLGLEEKFMSNISYSSNLNPNENFNFNTNENENEYLDFKLNSDSNISNTYSYQKIEKYDKENNSNISLITSNQENKENNNLSFLFTNLKAGMQGLDRDKINKIIQETTKDSIITKHKNEEFEKVKNTVDSYKKKLNSLHKSQSLIQHNKKIADQKIKEIEALRKLDKIWMHLDMDMFYAAIEIRDNPTLKDIPIAVGDERMVSTSNYIARKFGVRSAMPGFLAKKLCPQLIFVPCNFIKYKKDSESIMKILSEYDYNLDKRGLDEAFLDLTKFAFENYIADEDEFEGLIKEIKKKIFNETKLTCSIGISTNKMLAKICSDINKPDGMKILLTRNIQELKDFMKKMTVRKIPFVGEKMEQKLNMLGIKNCEDILEKYIDLFYIFNYNTYEFLIMSSLGISETEHKEVKESINKSISCSETFVMTKDIHKIKQVFDNVSKRMYDTMLNQNIVGKNLTIEIKDKNDKMVSKVISFKKNFETEKEINRNGWNSLSELMNNSSIRLIRIKLSGLSKTNPDALRKKKDNQISKWIDNLKINKIKNEIYLKSKIEDKEKEKELELENIDINNNNINNIDNKNKNDFNNEIKEMENYKIKEKEKILNSEIRKNKNINNENNNNNDNDKLPSMILLSVRKTSNKKIYDNNNKINNSLTKDIKLMIDEMSKSNNKKNFRNEKNNENNENSSNKIKISNKKHKKESKFISKKNNTKNYFNINEMFKLMTSKTEEENTINEINEKDKDKENDNQNKSNNNDNNNIKSIYKLSLLNTNSKSYINSIIESKKLDEKKTKKNYKKKEENQTKIHNFIKK